MYQFASHYNNFVWSYEQQKYSQYYPQLQSYYSKPYNYSYPQQTYKGWISNLGPDQYQQYLNTPKYFSKKATISHNDNLLEKNKQTKIISRKREKIQIKLKSEGEKKKLSTESSMKPSFSATEILNDKSTTERKDQFVSLSQKNWILETSVKPSNLYASFTNKKKEEIGKTKVLSPVQKNEKQKEELAIEIQQTIKDFNENSDFEEQLSKPENKIEKPVIKDMQNIEMKPSTKNTQIISENLTKSPSPLAILEPVENCSNNCDTISAFSNKKKCWCGCEQ